MIPIRTNKAVEDVLYRIFLDSKETEKFKECLSRHYNSEQNPDIKSYCLFSIEKMDTIKKWQKVRSIYLIFSGLFIAKEVYYGLSLMPHSSVVSLILKASTTLIISQIANHEIEKNIKELSLLLLPIINSLNQNQNGLQQEL